MSNPIAIVTGSSRGIGAATARLLGQHGYDVCVNYRGAAKAAGEVVADIQAAGARAIAVQADVSQRAEVARLFETVDAKLGTVSALVNNAGIVGPRCRVEKLSLDALEKVLAINVVGLVHCAQQAIRRMSTGSGGKGGSIVNISSGSAYIGNAGNAVHYAVSKGAVNSFTIGLSQEVAAQGIRVNAVSPGMTRTDMPGEEVLARAGASIPMGRVGEPREIAEAVLWLLSDRAGYTAGANIRVSGGRP